MNSGYPKMGENSDLFAVLFHIKAFDVQLSQLLFANLARAFRHQALSFLSFRKGDHLSNT